MTNRLTTLERAFEMAKSGTYASTSDISLALAKEGYANAGLHLHGRVLVRQLGALCRQAQLTAVRTPPNSKKAAAAKTSTPESSPPA